MRMRQNSIYLWMLICLGILVLTGASAVAAAQSQPDFSGQWKQDNDRCQPQRKSELTLHIEHHASELTVETTMVRDSSAPRHSVQKYTTDGKVSISTGADGDEFHTSIIWKDSSLFFSIEEHEDGRIILSKETWSVIENGATLLRVRVRQNGDKQTLYFRRIPASPPLAFLPGGTSNCSAGLPVHACFSLVPHRRCRPARG